MSAVEKSIELVKYMSGCWAGRRLMNVVSCSKAGRQPGLDLVIGR